MDVALALHGQIKDLCAQFCLQEVGWMFKVVEAEVANVDYYVRDGMSLSDRLGALSSPTSLFCWHFVEDVNYVSYVTWLK